MRKNNNGTLWILASIILAIVLAVLISFFTVNIVETLGRKNVTHQRLQSAPLEGNTSKTPSVDGKDSFMQYSKPATCGILQNLTNTHLVVPSNFETIENSTIKYKIIEDEKGYEIEIVTDNPYSFFNPFSNITVKSSGVITLPLFNGNIGDIIIKNLGRYTKARNGQYDLLATGPQPGYEVSVRRSFDPENFGTCSPAVLVAEGQTLKAELSNIHYVNFYVYK